MRSVLMEAGDFHRGGLAKWCYILALGLKGAGCNVTVFCTGRKGYYAFLAEQGGVRVYASGSDPHSLYESILKDRRVDVVLSFVSDRVRSSAASLDVPNIAVIDSPHHIFEPGGRDGLLSADIGVSHYITTTRATGLLLTEGLGIAQNRVATIPKAIDADRPFNDPKPAQPLTRAGLDIPQTHKVFLHPASFSPRKGHFLLAEAVGLARKEWDNFTVLCIGDVLDQAYHDAFAEHIKQAGLDGRIRLLGYRRDVESFLDLADAVVLPSLVGGWGMAMNESLAVGRPVILTDAGGAAEAVNSEEIGFISLAGLDPLKLTQDEYLALMGRKAGFGEAAIMLSQAMGRLRHMDVRPQKEIYTQRLRELCDLEDIVLPAYLGVIDSAIKGNDRVQFAVTGGLLKDIGRISMERDDLNLKCRAYELQCHADERRIGEQANRILTLEAELAGIYNSDFWALATRYYRLRDHTPLRHVFNALRGIKRAM